MVEKHLSRGLVLFSNERPFRLSGGVKTDIYINLRYARSSADALEFFTRCLENPLRRLDIARFVEVPDSVSCFAGPLLTRTKIPYITIRETEKVGRVLKGRIIGEYHFGERVAMFDDVIQDGATKIDPYRVCVGVGLRPETLVVLVDREGGWREKFEKEKIAMNVWAGMTLHDVRRHLIQTFGVMERCDPAREAKNPIIVALDGKSWKETLPIVDELRTTGCIFKVNDLLLRKGAEWLLPNLSVYGRVLLDFKGHDIPNTLENYARLFRKYPPWAITVHGSGGEEMMRMVVDAFKGMPTLVLAVTVLTSFDRVTCEEIYSRLPLDQVEHLAAIAYRAGVHGFVCSPIESPRLRHLYPDKKIVTSGVRSKGVGADDQSRVKTPAEAIDGGATHIVMGRQIFGSPDPVAEVKRILTEELKISL